MTSGGARARSGPAPDPNALRRDRKSDGEWTTLPASGRPGRAPSWPLTEASERELELWKREWKRPQALMWEQHGQEVIVALYVRRLSESELPGSQVTLGTLVRQLQEDLGISNSGLQRNRWKIADSVGPQVDEPTAGNVVSARDRFGKRAAS